MLLTGKHGCGADTGHMSLFKTAIGMCIPDYSLKCFSIEIANASNIFLRIKSFRHFRKSI